MVNRYIPRFLVAAGIAMAFAGLPGCYDDVFPEFPDAAPPPFDASADDNYLVDMTYSPLDVHPGDVVSFTFAVTQEGNPVDGLQPDCSYVQRGGSIEGVISLSAGEDAGTYVGKRAFNADGTYEISFEFTGDGGTPISRSFEVTAQSH